MNSDESKLGLRPLALELSFFYYLLAQVRSKIDQNYYI